MCVSVVGSLMYLVLSLKPAGIGLHVNPSPGKPGLGTWCHGTQKFIFKGLFSGLLTRLATRPTGHKAENCHRVIQPHKHG